LPASASSCAQAPPRPRLWRCLALGWLRRRTSCAVRMCRLHAPAAARLLRQPRGACVNACAAHAAARPHWSGLRCAGAKTRTAEARCLHTQRRRPARSARRTRTLRSRGSGRALPRAARCRRRAQRSQKWQGPHALAPHATTLCACSLARTSASKMAPVDASL
jgi:hypothetical protein